MVHSFFKLSSDDKKFNIKANVRHGSPLFLPQATHWNSAVSQGSQVTKGGDKRFREILRQGSWKFLEPSRKGYVSICCLWASKSSLV